jgi:hypothetical protein
MLWIVRIVLAAVEWTRGNIRRIGAEMRQASPDVPINYQTLGVMLCSRYIAVAIIGVDHSEDVA